MIAEAVSEGRIGRPQFVRCSVVTRDDAPHDSVLALLVDMTSDLFGVRPKDAGAGAYRLLSWPDGRGALLMAGVGEPRLDLLVMGSRGSLYFDETFEADANDRSAQ
jgi:hypothetical protein